jgi:uncharacterized protein
MVAWLLSSSLSTTFVSMMMLSLGGKNGDSSSEAMAVAAGASTTASSHSSDRIIVTGLHRFAVKGLSADTLPQVTFTERGETFPDDRRYALLLDNKAAANNFKPGEWLHKENFLCAFTAPKLLAQLESSYRIINNVPPSSSEQQGDKTEQKHQHQQQGLLTIRERATGIELLAETNLATAQGRLKLGDFLSKRCGQTVTCVTGDSSSTQKKQDFQFGNTSSGVQKNNGNTRTIHMVNENTVQEVSKKLGIDLNPTRFRPNIVFRGPPAWSEFDWIDKCLQVVGSDGRGGGGSSTSSNGGGIHDSDDSSPNGLKMRVISRTVRCQGVSVDPLDDPNLNEVDIPGLLAKHFPQHGPYLGVYAVIESPGTLAVGQELAIVEE